MQRGGAARIPYSHTRTLYLQEKILGIEPGQRAVAFTNKSSEPHLVCNGEPGRVYVYSWRSLVMEFIYKDHAFVGVSRNLHTSMWGCTNVCYIPTPHRIIVLDDWKMIKVFSLKTANRMWEVKGQVDGKDFNPHGMAFYTNHNLLLVADGENSRILVFLIETGEHVQTISLPQLSTILDICLLPQPPLVEGQDRPSIDTLVVWHKVHGYVTRFQISYLKLEYVKDKRQDDSSDDDEEEQDEDHDSSEEQFDDDDEDDDEDDDDEEDDD